MKLPSILLFSLVGLSLAACGEKAPDKKGNAKAIPICKKWDADLGAKSSSALKSVDWSSPMAACAAACGTEDPASCKSLEQVAKVLCEVDTKGCNDFCNSKNELFSKNTCKHLKK